MRPPHVDDLRAMLGRLGLYVLVPYCGRSRSRGRVHRDRLQISATSWRVASGSPSMSRGVRARLVGPASACTSRRLPRDLGHGAGGAGHACPGEQGDAGDNRRTPVEWPALFTHHSRGSLPCVSNSSSSCLGQVWRGGLEQTLVLQKR